VEGVGVAWRDGEEPTNVESESHDWKDAIVEGVARMDEEMSKDAGRALCSEELLTSKTEVDIVLLVDVMLSSGFAAGGAGALDESILNIAVRLTVRAGRTERKKVE
jgi:hypothetical protein